MPAGPEPMTAARRPVAACCSNGIGGSRFSSSIDLMTMSPAYRWESRMAIASSTSSRRQCSSHGAGQTRPSTEGNGIVRLKIRVDSRKLPSAFCFRKPGMSMWLGHLFWHGGRQYALWSLKISSRLVRRRRRTSSVWVWTTIPSSHVREHEIGGCSSPSTSTTHIRHAPKPGSFGS